MRKSRRRSRSRAAPGSPDRDCREGFPHTALDHENQVPAAIVAKLHGDRRCTAFDGRFTVDSYAPCLALARLLIRAGMSGDRLLEVYRGTTLCFRVRLATAARLEVRDSATGTPVFVPWRQRSMRTACEVAKSPPTLPGEPPAENNAPVAPPRTFAEALP
jgi:hypothetical protein